MASANEQLLLAASTGDLDTVKEALANGANIDAVTTNSLRQTALLLATFYCRQNVVLYLISQGANVEAHDSLGITALMYAVNSSQIMHIILSNGANVNTKSFTEGQTALMIAAQFSQKVAVEHLIKYGANINIKDNDGRTALDLAINHKFPGSGGDYLGVITLLSALPAGTPGPAGVPPGDINPSLSAATQPDKDVASPSSKRRKMSHDTIAYEDVASPSSKRRKMSHDTVACKEYTKDQFERLPNEEIMELVNNETVLGLDDLSEVSALLKEESANWEDICTSLHIKRNKIEELKTNNKSQTVCLNDALADWLKMNYNHQTHGKPKWRMIAKSVIHVNKILFLHIASLYTKTGVRVA